MTLISDKFIEANKTFLKSFLMIVDKIENQNNMEEYSSLIFCLIEKFKENPEIMNYLFGILKKFSSMKKFKELVSEEFINSIFLIISSTTSHNVATMGLRILDSLVKTTNNRDMIRSNKPISFIVKLLKRFKDDNLLSFHACGLLSKVLEKEDFYVFLEIMKIKNLKNLEKELENEIKFQGVLNEIKELVFSSEDESFNILKKNITRVLILMSKDKNFLQLLKDIYSLDTFVVLLKNDLDIYSKAKNNEEQMTNEEILLIENMLPDLIRLILSLLKNYDLDYDLDLNNYHTRGSVYSRNSINLKSSMLNNSLIMDTDTHFNNSPNILKDIYLCFLKFLLYFNKDIVIVYDILEYISSKDKLIIGDILKDFDLNEMNLILTKVLRNFHNNKWMYQFLSKLFQSQSLSTNFSIDFFLINVTNLNLLLSSIKTEYSDDNKEDIINLFYQTSLYFIITSSGNYNYDENSFKEFDSFTNKFLNFVSDAGIVILDTEIINSLITIVFSCLENKNFGLHNLEDKSKLILIFLEKIIFGLHLNEDENFFGSISKYFMLRLSRIADLKLENANKYLFNDELICNLILNVLSTINSQNEKNLRDSLTKDTLQTIFHILNLSDSQQISKFLRENGFIFLMQIFLNGIYDIEINKLVISIIYSFSITNFKESAQIFKNFFALRNFINQLKEIKFSKGINEKIYYEILVYALNIIKSCEYCEAVEETNLIDHLLIEYNDIFSFYLDTKNRILEIISEILSLFSKESAMLKSLLNSKLPAIMENIFKNISDSTDKSGHDNIIINLTNVFISFFQSKEYSKLIYNNYKRSLVLIKNITLNCQLTEDCLTKLLTLCNILVEYENSEIIKEKIVTPIFLRELSMKIPSSQKTFKEMIEKCITLIENPISDITRKTINESNSKLIKELSDLVKADRKNALKKKDSIVSNYTPRELMIIKEDTNNDNEEGQRISYKIPNSSRRKSLICIEDNPYLKYHFDSTIADIGSITDLILEYDESDNRNMEKLSEQLFDHFKKLCIFAKDEDNIKKISDTFIIDKLIVIIDDNNKILTFAKDQGLNLIDRLSEDEDFIIKLFENENGYKFFLKELNKIGKIYFPDSSEYYRNKVSIVTKIMSKLSVNKQFNINNKEYLSISNLSNIISFVKFDKDIILNILVIFNNIIVNNPLVDFTTLKLSSLINDLWKKYKGTRVIEKIMKIIETLYLEENIIRDLLEYGIIDTMNEVLQSSKTDSEGIFNLLELINILMFHRYFVAKIIEQKTLNNILKTISNNVFNTKLIEKSCSIFLKGAKTDKNFITILGTTGVKEFCLQILSKYMTTCHSFVIKEIEELIFVLISDENNLQYFSKGENMNIILNTLKTNLKIKDHVIISLKIVNIIANRDAELALEKARKRKRSLDDKNKLRSSLIISPCAIEEQEDLSVTYDLFIFIEIINEILSTYDEFIDIINLVCELMNNLFKISSDITIKKYMVDVILINADHYLVKKEYVELFLKTIYQMIKADKGLLNLDFSSILFYISKHFKLELTSSIVLSILKILKQVVRAANINTSSNLIEIIKILKFLEKNKSYHNDKFILIFSHILLFLFVNTSFYKEVSNEFIVFLLEYLISKPTNSDIHCKLIEDLKNMSVYFQINYANTATQVADSIKEAFTINFNDNNTKNMINLFQIISSLCIQSETLKNAMNENKFHSYLKDLLIKDCFKDHLIGYQAKGCLLNIKLKKYFNSSSKLTNSSSLKNMSNNLCQIEVKDEVINFLKQERFIKIYTEKGEAKERFLIMNENLDKIISYHKKKNSNEILEEMEIKDMDSCVRSCGTAAFSRAKGIFTKKPKPARCFSILGFKTLHGQKTFNVECDKEEDCIKYVDYISILIQNHKKSREDYVSDLNSSQFSMDKFK